MSGEEERIAQIPRNDWNEILKLVWLPMDEWADNTNYYQLRLRALVHHSI